MSTGTNAPRVLVLGGGLIHLVNQLAVALAEPTREVAVAITGVLVHDPAALEDQHHAIDLWLATLKRAEPQRFGVVRLVRDLRLLQPGEWDVACLNNQWNASQREPVERLRIPALIVCGDGLGIYYRCAREPRAILPSLLHRPIPEPRRRVRYVLEGAQPPWHRPPGPVEPVPALLRSELFAFLVEALEPEWSPIVRRCLAASPPDGPLWVCSVPNLARQFPGGHLPLALLGDWLAQLGLDGGFPSRLLLIDHPKAPPDGSFGPTLPTDVTSPIRSAVPVEVLVRGLAAAAPGRELVVAGLTSALYGVRRLTPARVVWLRLGPLWRRNPLYRRQPLEFLHRLLRVWRMAWLTRQLEGRC